MRAYDFIVTRMAPYNRLQQLCVERLELADGDVLLCAGIGTGNEIDLVLKTKRNVRITGVDYSKTALIRAQNKAKQHGIVVDTRLMDIQNLDFPDAVFNKALCVHVTDFVGDSNRVTNELMRVLKRNGKFAITFPSAKEDFSFGLSVIGDATRYHIKNRTYHKIPLVLTAALLGAIVYLPFLFRKEKRSYDKPELEKLFSSVTEDYQIEEFPLYCDFIVSGCK
jgi:ubiquinone/menaquinone biosynthesis C-methylase UbiE